MLAAGGNAAAGCAPLWAAKEEGITPAAEATLATFVEGQTAIGVAAGIEPGAIVPTGVTHALFMTGWSAGTATR
jgi:hypothetical protein